MTQLQTPVFWCTDVSITRRQIILWVQQRELNVPHDDRQHPVRGLAGALTTTVMQATIRETTLGPLPTLNPTGHQRGRQGSSSPYSAASAGNAETYIGMFTHALGRHFSRGLAMSNTFHDCVSQARGKIVCSRIGNEAVLRCLLYSGHLCCVDVVEPLRSEEARKWSPWQRKRHVWDAQRKRNSKLKSN